MTLEKQRFLKQDMKALSIKGNVENSDFIKSKNCFSLQNSTKRMKRQATEWEKIFALHFWDNSIIYVYILYI